MYRFEDRGTVRCNTPSVWTVHTYISSSPVHACELATDGTLTAMNHCFLSCSGWHSKNRRWHLSHPPFCSLPSSLCIASLVTDHMHHHLISSMCCCSRPQECPRDFTFFVVVFFFWWSHKLGWTVLEGGWAQAFYSGEVKQVRLQRRWKTAKEETEHLISAQGLFSALPPSVAIMWLESIGVLWKDISDCNCP